MPPRHCLRKTARARSGSRSRCMGAELGCRPASARSAVGPSDGPLFARMLAAVSSRARTRSSSGAWATSAVVDQPLREVPSSLSADPLFAGTLAAVVVERTDAIVERCMSPRSRRSTSCARSAVECERRSTFSLPCRSRRAEWFRCAFGQGAPVGIRCAARIDRRFRRYRRVRGAVVWVGGAVRQAEALRPVRKKFRPVFVSEKWSRGRTYE